MRLSQRYCHLFLSALASLLITGCEDSFDGVIKNHTGSNLRVICHYDSGERVDIHVRDKVLMRHLKGQKLQHLSIERPSQKAGEIFLTEINSSAGSAFIFNVYSDNCEIVKYDDGSTVTNIFWN